MSNKRSEQELLNSFINLFKLLGMEEENAKKLFEGISGADLKNSPEIRKLIDEHFEIIKIRREEERMRERREQEKLKLLERVKSLDSQIENVEAEHKKLLEQRDEILRNLT